MRVVPELGEHPGAEDRAEAGLASVDLSDRVLAKNPAPPARPVLAIITWIENTYHRRRRQHTLGRLTPIEFEILQQAAPAA